MKILLATLLLPLLQHWIAAPASACDPAKCALKCATKIMARTVAAGEDDATYVVAVAPGTGAGCVKTVMVVGAGEPVVQTFAVRSGGVNTVRVANALVVAADAKKGSGYLGVALGEVPEALATQFDLDDRGVIVLNVVDGSPASNAGIERHDVIIAINGRTVDGDVPGVAEVIQSYEPGDAVTVTVMRGGDEKTLAVVLGTRSDVGKVDWLFDLVDTDAEIEDRISTRLRMLMKGPGGEWMLKDFGDLAELDELSVELRNLLPLYNNIETKFCVDGDRKSFKIIAAEDGTTLMIAQEDGGQITVTRTDENGEETVRRYPNEDELAADDEEAAELLDHSGNHHMFHFDIGNFGHFTFNMDELAADLGEMRIALKARVEDAGDAYKDAMVQLENLRHDFHGGAGPHRFFFGSTDDDDNGAPKMFSMQFGTPRHSFHVNPDGTIDVTVRKGDSELVQTFSDAADLSRRKPDLYKKYEELDDIE